MKPRSELFPILSAIAFWVGAAIMLLGVWFICFCCLLAQLRVDQWPAIAKWFFGLFE